MLKFITGRASSGKTYQTIKMAENAVLKGEKVIILVPEQFSFECEKSVLSMLGDNLSQNISVLSFSRICDEVDRVTGGVCTKALKNSDILIIMKKAISDCGDKLVSFKRFSRSDGFAQRMAQTVYELKINCISPLDLYTAAEKCEDASLSVKLKDTALIFETFNNHITEKYIDPSDKLNILYDKLNSFKFFEGKTVFIDSFDGFTGQQFKIIERVLSQSKYVYITLNLDAENNSEYGVFANTRLLKEKIINMAKSLSLDLGQDIVLDNPRYENKSLAAVEEYLFSGKKTRDSLEDVFICAAATVYDETEFVARQIRKTVREKGARYRDMVIIARDVSPYVIPLKSAMAKNGIPLFCDERTPLSPTAAAAMFVSAAQLLCGITTERLFKYYKSGVEYFTPEEIGTLENYAFVWDIDNGLWFKDWDMNPEGLNASKHKDNEKKLEIANELRKKAIIPIQKNIKNIENDAKSIIVSLISLLEDTGAVSSLINLYNAKKESGDTAAADVIRGSYDAIISVLDSIAAAYKNEELSTRDFCLVLQSAISLETVGSIPASLDEVIFGAADKIRPARPEYVFVLGANQGVFPSGAKQNGVFSNTDREKMIDLGIKIPDRTVYESINEDYLVYTNICSAKKALTISFSNLLPGGEEGMPSAFLSGLCNAFDLNIQKEPGPLSIDNAPETENSAFSLFCRNFNNDKPAAMLLYNCLENTDLKAKTNYMLKSAQKPDLNIDKETAQNLFGNNLKMSPSAFDNFSHCHFKYFCKNALGVDSLQKSDFNASQRGTVFHYVLERAVREHGKELSRLSHSDIDSLAEAYIEDYVKSVPGFESVRTSKTDYLLRSISRGLKSVLYLLSDEFKNTDFVPVACELRISDEKDGDIPSLRIPVSKENNLVLNGVVDRLDRYKDYIRVIDYKTGTVVFKLSNLLYCQNMQMLLYLYTVCRDKKYGGKPAAILYKPAKRNLSGDDKDTCMNGIIADDMEIISAMDKSFSGKYIPSLKSKNAFVEKDAFDKIFKFMEKKLAYSAGELYNGNVSPNPVNGYKSKACDYCDFSAICRVVEKDIPNAESLSNEDALSEIERWGEDG